MTNEQMDLLQQLRRAGLVIHLDGDDLLVRDVGSYGDLLRQRKAEIVALLREEPNALAPANIRSMDGGGGYKPIAAERQEMRRWLHSG